MLREWVEEHPEIKLPVTFDKWFTQPGFCRYLDQTLQLPYVGTSAEDDRVILRSGQEHLRQEHMAAMKGGGQPIFKPVTISYKGGKEH
jgi:hypothetical protein